MEHRGLCHAEPRMERNDKCRLEISLPIVGSYATDPLFPSTCIYLSVKTDGCLSLPRASLLYHKGRHLRTPRSPTRSHTYGDYSPSRLPYPTSTLHGPRRTKSPKGPWLALRGRGTELISCRCHNSYLAIPPSRTKRYSIKLHSILVTPASTGRGSLVTGAVRALSSSFRILPRHPK